MALTPDVLAATLELAESGRHNIDPTEVAVRPYPFPYVAALAMNNDIDSTSRAAFEDWHDFVSGTGPTPYGDGLGLEVGDSFWVWCGTNGKTLSMHRQYPDEHPRVDSPDLNRIVELGRAGWLDTLHSFGNWRQDHKTVRHDLGHRDDARYALDRLDSLGVKPRLYVNHSGSPSNVGGPWGHYQKADEPGHAMYCLDLLKAFGIRFFWTDACMDMEKFGNELDFGTQAELRAAFADYDFSAWLRRRDRAGIVIPINMPPNENEQRNLLIGIFNRTFFPVRAADGTTILVFKRHRGADQPTATTFPYQVTSENLDALEALGGAVIVYQHFGVFSGRGRPRERSLRRNTSPPVLDEHAVACWQDIAARVHAGRLFVATTARLLHYLWLRKGLKLTVEKTRERWHVRLLGVSCPAAGWRALSSIDFNGLSFVIPAIAPEVTVTAHGSAAPLELRRAPDPGHPDCHALYRPWTGLEWPRQSAAAIN